jgi:hypothetical protein
MTFGKRHGISLGGLIMISCSVRSESKTGLAANEREWTRMKRGLG